LTTSARADAIPEVLDVEEVVVDVVVVVVVVVEEEEEEEEEEGDPGVALVNALATPGGTKSKDPCCCVDDSFGDAVEGDSASMN